MECKRGISQRTLKKKEKKNTGVLHNKPRGQVQQGHIIQGPKERKKKNCGLLHNEPKTEVHSGVKLTGL
jgi:hypothetical protein